MALRVSTPVVGPEKVLINNLTMDASKVVFVRADCNKNTPGTSVVDWRVKSNKASTILAYKSRLNRLSATITLDDAADVDDGNTFKLNGLTFTAESTAGDVSAAARKYLITGTAAEDVVSLTAMLNDATYGVPGLAFTAAALVISMVPVAAPGLPNGAPTILFQQGTSDVAEIAFANTTLTNLMKDNSFTSVTGADNSTTNGTLYQQYADGYPYCYLGYTDTSAAETTLTIGATFHDSL
jgi:hypothetical protein